MWRSCNYYYQYLFQEGGNRAFDMSAVKNGNKVDATVYTSPTIDTKTGKIYVKMVNSEGVDKIFTVNTGSNTKYVATLDYITAHDPSVKNQGDNDYYSSNPDLSQVEYTETIVPQTKGLGTVQKSFQVLIPENSICVLKLTPAE